MVSRALDGCRTVRYQQLAGITDEQGLDRKRYATECRHRAHCCGQRFASVRPASLTIRAGQFTVLEYRSQYLAGRLNVFEACRAFCCDEDYGVSTVLALMACHYMPLIRGRRQWPIRFLEQHLAERVIRIHPIFTIEHLRQKSQLYHRISLV